MTGLNCSKFERILIEKYHQVPSSSGVYLMKDLQKRIIYVGKAKNLKTRLSFYFKSQQNKDPKTKALIQTIKDFDFIVTNSDHEALILEANLIKQHQPKYNVILKDQKNYPLLRIDMSEEFPGIERARRIKNDGAIYFGPYSSSKSLNLTLRQIQKIFKLRRCKTASFKKQLRPCLNYQIKTCLAPCCMDVSPERYIERVKDAILFLKGNSGQVLKKLKLEMRIHAISQAFEKAAQVRDIIFAIEKIMAKQTVVCPDMRDRDIIALAVQSRKAVVTVMMVRSGHLIGTVHYHFNMGFREEEEIIPAFLEAMLRTVFGNK